MQQDATSFEGLTQRQITALPHLIRPGTLAEQAKNARIARTTLYRWLQDPDFRRTLEQLREDSIHLAESQLQAMSYQAAGVIFEALHDEDPNVRFRAAQAALKHPNSLQYGQRLKRRIDRLAEAFDLSKEAE